MDMFSVLYNTLVYRSDRRTGTICFFLGIALVIMKWGLIGMCVEGFGFLNLFGNFLPTILAVARQLPVLSTILDYPIIGQFADFLTGKTRPKYTA